jgi:drug/metabolite transporter (DMT)-like permease
MIKVGVLLAVIPLVMWGAGDYIAAKMSRKMSPFATNFAYSLYGLLLPLVVCFWYGFPSVTALTLAKFALVSCLLTAGFLSMVKGFSSGATGLIAPIANAYALITFIVSFLFFHESVKLVQLPAALLIIFGICLVSYHEEHRKNKVVLYSIGFGLVAMLLFGVGFALFATITTYRWYQNQLLLSVVSTFTAPLLLYKYEKKVSRKNIAKILTNKLSILGGFVGSFGTLGLFAAIGHGGGVVVVATITSAAPLFTALLAYKFDHEHLSIRQRFGTILVVGGVIALNLVS